MEMNLAIELPEEIARQLKDKWGDLPRRAREAVAIEACRSGALSEAQVQSLLGLTSRWQTDAFLKQAGVYLDYSEADLQRDLQTSKQLRGK